GRQCGYHRVGICFGAGIFTPWRRTAALPALPGRPAGWLHGLAPAVSGHPVDGATRPVYCMGAAPGAADLITVRGQRLLTRCQVCLYAGSIMPDDLLEHCPPDRKIVYTGPLTSP